MLSTFTTAQFANAANWQGVDDEPTIDSENLVKSGGVAASKLSTYRTVNLLNENDIELGCYIENDGNIAYTGNKNFGISRRIAVTAGNKYYIRIYGTIGRDRGLSFWDNSGNKVGNKDTFNGSYITAPENAAYLVFNMKWSGTKNTKVVCIENPTPEQKIQYIPYYKLDNEVISTEEITKPFIGDCLETIKTKNLFNLMAIKNGCIENGGGYAFGGTSWKVSDFIPVIAGHQYKISATTIGRTTGISFFDANKEVVQAGGTTTIFQTHTAPNNAAYMVFNVYNNGNWSTDIMVQDVTDTPESEYEPYNKISTNSVQGLIPLIDSKIRDANSGVMSVTKTGDNLVVSVGQNSLNFLLTKPYGEGNPVVNYNGGSYNGHDIGGVDDIAPLHALNITIGANHGQSCKNATITSHGLVNTDIGTEWLDSNNVKFYIMRIVDVNHVIVLSENSGTMESPSFTPLTAGTLNNGNRTLTVSSVSSTQLYPALKNHVVEIITDKGFAISQDGEYSCEYLDIVESYDIMNPASTLQKIIAEAGQDIEHVFNGDTAITVKNVYRVINNLTVLVIGTVIPRQRIAFENIMFAQSSRIGENGVVKYYVPNMLPYPSGGGYLDFSKPLAMTWGSGVNAIYTGAYYTKNQDYPINRVIQYDGNVIGEATGFLTDRGVGQSLFDFTTKTFELRNNTGKVYPWGVNSDKVGNYLEVGQIYNAIMYKSFFIPETSGNRLSMYHFSLDRDSAEYVFVDYSDSILDNVDLNDNSLNGKKVELLEYANITLKSNVYNDGFYVDAVYVSGESCYLIAKIF